MSRILEGVEERHEGPEPRVVTKDVQEILNAVINPDNDEEGKPVSLIANKAKISTRTVYRVLQADRESISLDLADRLCLAADAHIAMCRLVWPDGEITPYMTLRNLVQ